MEKVITGIGVIASCGIGKERFWQAQDEGLNSICSDTLEARVKDFKPEEIFGPRGLKNIDKSALMLMAAAKEAIEGVGLEINEASSDGIGICTGTTFAHLCSYIEFDREVFNESMDFANPALFPSVVVNAASSQVAIRFKLRGFNTTLSTGYASSLSALDYGASALDNNAADTVFCAGLEVLSPYLSFGFKKLGYLAGIRGVALSCPFDKRRNGPLLGEAAVVLCLEDIQKAKQRNAFINAKIKSIVSSFGENLAVIIKKAINDAGISLSDIGYISSSANSSVDVDKKEIIALKKIFGAKLDKIPVSSIKSMLGDTISASGALQIISCIGAMQRGVIPPTINFKDKDPDCDVDCVPNKAQRKDVKFCLVISSGPGGYGGACVLEKP